MNMSREHGAGKQIQHIFEWGYQVMLIVLVCAMGFCTYAALFTLENYTPIILLIGTAVYLLFMVAVYNSASHLSEQTLKHIGLIMLTCFAVGLLAVGLNIKSARQADLINVHCAAVNYLKNGSWGDVKEYLDRYPFNRNIVYILTGVYRLGEWFGVSDYRTSGTIFGALCLFVAALGTYGVANQIGGRKLGISALAFFITNPVIYLTTSYYYTDTIVMPFFIGTMYLAMLAEKKKSKVGAACLFCVTGFVAHMGIQIRKSAGIVVIAMLIYFWIADWKKAAKSTAFIIIGMIPSHFIWKGLEIWLGETINGDLTFPISHCFMMGLNSKSGGQWSSEMWSITAQAPTYSEKIAVNVAQIKRQIGEMGPIGLCRLWVEKLRCLWADGTSSIHAGLSVAVQYGNLYEYTVGTKSFVTNYIAQIVRVTTLICMVPGAVALKWKYKAAVMIIPTTIFGYTLFHLFWEVSPRYLVMLFPFMFLFATMGVAFIHQEFCVERPFVLRWQFEQSKKRRTSIYTIISKIIIILQIATVIIAAFCSNKLIGTVGDRYETRANQPKRQTSSLISMEKLTQTFSLKQPFNGITVFFMKPENVPDGQMYQFLLRDGDEVLFQYTFPSDNVKVGEVDKKNFSFDTVYPKGMRQYEIELVAVGNYENNISVYRTNKGTWDYYEAGVFMEGENPTGDMNFGVWEKFEGPLVSPKVFYTLVAMSLFLESLVYCWAKWNERNRSGREEMFQ